MNSNGGMMEWVSVQSNLPKWNRQYLVWYHDGIFIRYWNPDDVCWDGEDGDDYWRDVNEVEYWSELPQPPRVK